MSLELPSALAGLLTAPDLHDVFGLVCGQNPEHTWAPGGTLLPCCQRCLGLYFGAVLALLLHILLRPKLTGRFLELHGAFLLLMVPLGFHWVPQGPAVRTISGLLYGAAVATFLWLPLAARFSRRLRTLERGHSCPQQRAYAPQSLHSAPLQQRRRSFSIPPYALGIIAPAVLLPLLAAQGGRAAAFILTFAAATGLLSFSALTTANLLLAVRGATRFLYRALRHRAAPLPSTSIPTGSRP